MWSATELFLKGGKFYGMWIMSQNLFKKKILHNAMYVYFRSFSLDIGS